MKCEPTLPEELHVSCSSGNIVFIQYRDKEKEDKIWVRFSLSKLYEYADQKKKKNEPEILYFSPADSKERQLKFSKS